MADSVFYIVSVAQVPLTALAPENEAGLAFHRLETDAQTSQNDKSPDAPVLSRNAWLFQSNPILYDLRGALRSLKDQVWSVSRYAKEIRNGDRVYLWEAGRLGGVVGVAEITESARPRPEPPEQLPFARVAEAFAGERIRARLRVLSVIEPLIPRQAVVSSPDLSALGILRCSRGTNFRLSIDQWQALNGLIVCGGA